MARKKRNTHKNSETRVTYVGPFAAVSMSLDGTKMVVHRNETVEVSPETAQSLLRQPKNWKAESEPEDMLGEESIVLTPEQHQEYMEEGTYSSSSSEGNDLHETTEQGEY